MTAYKKAVALFKRQFPNSAVECAARVAALDRRQDMLDSFSAGFTAGYDASNKMWKAKRK